MSPAPTQLVEPVEKQTNPANMSRGTAGTQTSPARIPNTQSGTQTTKTAPSPQPKTGKGAKKKSSQNNQTRPQQQPSSSSSGTNPSSAFQSSNLDTDRPHIHCLACGEDNHFRKDCH